MFQTFKISYSLKNTYFVNAFLYSIKQIPLLGKLIPQSIYGVDGLKILVYILGFMKEVVSTFAGKILYLLLMVILPIRMYEVEFGADCFTQILFFLTLVGVIVNTGVFNPSKDKYYAVILLRMDAYRYAVTDYTYYTIKQLVGMLVAALIIGMINGVPVWICLLLPVYIVAAKAIYIARNLNAYSDKGVCMNENHLNYILWILVFVFLCAAYALPVAGIMIPWQYTAIIMLVVILISIPSVRLILHFQYYREMYQELLQERRQGLDVKATSRDIQIKSSRNKISADTDIKSGRHGFEYFNDLFMKRHRKVLFRPVLIVAAGALLVLTVLMGAILYLPDLRESINHIMLTMLPYMVFVMYLINRGTNFTTVLFMNCDHSMLTYNFYKKPSFILHLFQIRLRGIIKVNLIPAIVIAVGATLLLYLTGGTDQSMNYVIVPVSILALSIFFSVHYLTCYYLLQPYNSETELKSKTYQIIMSLTYLVTFYIMRVEIDTFVFGIGAISFCVIYCIVACVLVYKFADRTFRIRS